MASEHQLSFWADLAGKMGTPILAATLVGCLLSSRFELTHGILLGVGALLIFVNHGFVHHR